MENLSNKNWKPSQVKEYNSLELEGYFSYSTLIVMARRKGKAVIAAGTATTAKIYKYDI